MPIKMNLVTLDGWQGELLTWIIKLKMKLTPTRVAIWVQHDHEKMLENNKRLSMMLSREFVTCCSDVSRMLKSKSNYEPSTEFDDGSSALHRTLNNVGMSRHLRHMWVSEIRKKFSGSTFRFSTRKTFSSHVFLLLVARVSSLCWHCTREDQREMKQIKKLKRCCACSIDKVYQRNIFYLLMHFIRVFQSLGIHAKGLEWEQEEQKEQEKFKLFLLLLAHFKSWGLWSAFQSALYVRFFSFSFTTKIILLVCWTFFYS